MTYAIDLRSLDAQDIHNREIESIFILIKTFKGREIVLRKMNLNIVPSYRRSTRPPLQPFFNQQNKPVQSSDGVRDENVHQIQAVSSVPDPKPAESPQAIATDQLNHIAGFSTNGVIKSTEEADSEPSLRTALLGNANVDGGGKQESCTEDASTKPSEQTAEQENSQSNSAHLFVFPGGEPPLRLSSACREPKRNVGEQLAGDRQDLRIELNTFGNAAHVAMQMPPPSGPSFARIPKQLCSVIAAVICCVVLIAFGLIFGLCYFVRRQSVHPSNAVGVTHSANASTTLEV